MGEEIYIYMYTHTHTHIHIGFPGAASGKEPTCQCRRHKRRGFDHWIRTFPWRRAWQLIPVLPGEPHGQRSLWATVHGVANSQTQLTHSSFHKINLNKYIFSPTNNKYFWKSGKWKVLLFIILICLPIMNHIRYFIIHLKITYTFLYIKLSYSLPIFNWFLSYFLIDFQKTWMSFKYIVWVCHFFYMNYSEFLTTLKNNVRFLYWETKIKYKKYWYENRALLRGQKYPNGINDKKEEHNKISMP